MLCTMKHRTREFVWSTGLLGALLVPMFEGRAHAQPTRFEAPADLFYLHPLVNYQLPLSWRARWERERLSTNGVQANVGSISTKDFTTHVRVDIDEAANEHLRLLYHLDWLDTPHLDGAERQDWIGFELGGWHTRWGGGGAGVTRWGGRGGDPRSFSCASSLLQRISYLVARDLHLTYWN